MLPRSVVALVVLFAGGALFAQQPGHAPATCASAAECSQMTSDAIARQEFEHAHDLAWRAVQLGPRNDIALMYLLARTQSLSGRPHDSLVMLQRLAALGGRAEDVETSEDFRRVRALPQWAELLAAIRGVPAPAAAAPRAEAGSSLPPVDARPTPPEEGLAIPSSILSPLGLAYDAVSDRFVVADESSDTLKVVDERTGHAVDLVSRGWAGPYRTSALAIDARRGDLWTAGIDRSSDDDTPQSALHKLQLVSGRLLETIPLPTKSGATRIIDIAIARDKVFLLDAAGRRIFSIVPGTKTVRLETELAGITDPVSLALADDTVLYVAHAKGVLRLDLATRTRVPVLAAMKMNLASLQPIGWKANSLLGIQQDADGRRHAVRIRLNAAGTIATRFETLGPAALRAGAVYGGTFYYVAARQDGGGMIVRRYDGR